MIALHTDIETWRMRGVFATARDAISELRVVCVTLTGAQGHVGRGEAAGVDYDGETPESLCEMLRAVAPQLSDDVTGEDLLSLLPPGGARNALDCALWDLRAKERGRPVWQLGGWPEPRPVRTVLTIGLGTAEETRARAAEARAYGTVKIKLDGVRPLETVSIVREILPAARLVVDANQSWSRRQLDGLVAPLSSLGVELIEQPLPRGDDAALDGYDGAIPLAADESCTDAASLGSLVGRYAFVNVKLDKCGGLTAAHAMVLEAGRLGLGLMVGNMCGTSLAMAPAMLVAGACRYVDLDGPLLQTHDRSPPIVYDGDLMHCPPVLLWG